MDAARETRLSVMREGDLVVIHAGGELDFAAVEKLREALAHAAKCESEAILIDCRNVTFIDTETIKTMLGAQIDLADAGKTLRLRNCSPNIHRILTILGLADRFLDWPSA